MSIKNEVRIFKNLKQCLFENASDFFEEESRIDKFISIDDLSDNVFDKYQPLSVNFRFNNFYNDFVDLMVKKIKNLPEKYKQQIAEDIVESHIETLIQNKLKNEISRVLDSSNLHDDVSNILDKYRKHEKTDKDSLKKKITPKIVKALNKDEGIHNLIFDLLDELFEMSEQ